MKSIFSPNSLIPSILQTALNKEGLSGNILLKPKSSKERVSNGLIQSCPSSLIGNNLKV